MSTWGARTRTAFPSWLATHPPTPMTTSGRRRLSARQRPSSENTFSSAFSRTEQVLTSRTSASSGRSAGSRPCECASASAVLAESYSFIWQPKVRMNSLRGPSMLRNVPHTRDRRESGNGEDRRRAHGRASGRGTERRRVRRRPPAAGSAAGVRPSGPPCRRTKETTRPSRPRFGGESGGVREVRTARSPTLRARRGRGPAPRGLRPPAGRGSCPAPSAGASSRGRTR